MDLSLVRRLEEMSVNAWPDLGAVHMDGWVARFAGGVTSRANCLTALAPVGDAVQVIDAAERLYAAADLPAQVRISPIVPGGIDEHLAERGYAKHSETLAQIATLEAGHDLDPAVTLAPMSDSAWRAAYAAANPRFDAQALEIVAAIHAAIRVDKVFAATTEEGAIVALGFATLDRGWVSLQEIATAPSARGRGLARRLLGTLLAWGRARGGREAWLQVMADDTAAIPLYRSLGFTTVYRTHYRKR
jgi:ribosomal protein S18 acetylase RimI-like enzyme